ncbi:MAG: MFS transporter [Anaerolineae bacterium]
MKHLSRSGIIAYSMGSVAAGLFYAFNNFTLPLFLSFYTKDAIIIGWLSSTRSVEQAFIQPFVGGWSDRTWTRLGRRAPFFLIAMPISALFFVITTLIPHDPSLLGPVIVAVFIFSFMFNVGIDPYVALLADVTESIQRGTINGVAAVFGFLGQVVILIAAGLIWEQHHDWVFYLIALGLVLGFGIVALGVRERQQLVEGEERTQPTDSMLKPSLAPYIEYIRDRWRESRDAVKLLLVRFLYQIGVNAAVPFLTLFVSTQIGTAGWREMISLIPGGANLAFGNTTVANLDAQGVSQIVAALFLLVTMLFAIPCGWLGDHLGKKRVFRVGLLVMGIVALFAAFATSIPQLLFYLIFLGLGNAAVSILFFPYLSDLVRADQMGEFQGLSATAETGGIALSVLLAGALINLNLFDMKYRIIFIVTGIFLLLGVVAVSFVRAQLEAGAAPFNSPPALH